MADQSQAPVAQRQDVMSVDNNAIELISRAEIDQQIATAKKFPRSLAAFLESSKAMIGQDKQLADECFYALPRDGKIIEGPSIRFAEVIQYAWGNCRAAARIVAEGKEFITAQGAFHDLERNVAISFEVQRRIVGKTGRRFGPDMVAVTGNAAASIALRNAVIRGIPKAIWQPTYLYARALVAGDFANLGERRDLALEYAKKRLGVPVEHVLATLNLENVNQITGEHIVILRGLLQAIKDNDAEIDEVFPGTTPALAGITRADLGEVLKAGTKPEAEIVANTRKARTAEEPRNRQAEDVQTEDPAPASNEAAKINMTQNPVREAQEADGAGDGQPEGGEAGTGQAASGGEKTVPPGEEDLTPNERKLMGEVINALAGADTPEEIEVIADEFAGAIKAARPSVSLMLGAKVQGKMDLLKPKPAKKTPAKGDGKKLL